MENIYFMPDKARDLNQITFTDIYTRLMMLAQTVFKWEGLPNGIEEKYIERYLFNCGRCMFFHDFEKGWMVAKVADSGLLNYYDEPTMIRPVTTNQSQHYFDVHENGVDSCLIYNNAYAIPTHNTILLYAARLAEMQRTIDINIQAMKTPVLIKTSERKRMSLNAAYKQWDGNKPVIFGDNELELEDNFKVLNTSAPIVFDKLTIEKNKLWNECMTFLGVNNANLDKRERLVDDEVQANNEQILLSAQTMLNQRQEAARKMSELCGKEITVSLRNHQNPQNLIGAPELPLESEETI